MIKTKKKRQKVIEARKNMTKTPCNDHDDISVHIIQSFYYDPAHSVGVAKLYSMYIQLLVNGQK